MVFWESVKFSDVVNTSTISIACLSTVSTKIASGTSFPAITFSSCRTWRDSMVNIETCLIPDAGFRRVNLVQYVHVSTVHQPRQVKLYVDIETTLYM